jgi:2-oxo-4-hydroxy-4-carboxy-5-ureidoimidazoline decarboxylase
MLDSLKNAYDMADTTDVIAENGTLARWNELDAQAAAREVLPCCGSSAWAEALAARRPFGDAAELFSISDSVWAGLGEDDWREAFDSHPRIGQQKAKAATAESLAWSSDEQRAAMNSDEAAKLALAEANRQYEEKFGRIFIVCASGRSTSEILAICKSRMGNDEATEMLEAAEQQRQITQLRLRRWLGVS